MHLLHPSVSLLVACAVALLTLSACGNPAPLTGTGECEGIPNCTPENNTSNNDGGGDDNNVFNNVFNNVENNTQNNTPDPGANTCMVGATECVDATQQRRCFVDEKGTYWDTPTACPSGACQGDACCPDVCQLGEKVCTQAGVQTCEVQPNGCLGLGAPAACPAGQQCNDQGACISSCISDCSTVGQTQCFNEAATRTCLSVEPMCNKWSPVNNCQSGYICEDSACVEECPNPCRFDELFTFRCVSGRSEVCTSNPLKGFCLQWLPNPTSC